MMGNAESTPDRAVHQSPAFSNSRTSESNGHQRDHSIFSTENRQASNSSPKLPRRESTEFAGFSRRSSQRATSTTSSSAKHDGDNFSGYARSGELLQQHRKSPSLLDLDKRTTEPNSNDPISHEFWPNGRSPPKGPRAMVTPSAFPSEDETNKIAISELLKLEANERRQSSSSSGQHILRNTDEVLNDIDGTSGSVRFSNNSIRLEPQTATEYSKSEATTEPVSPVVEGRSLNEAACQGSISDSVAKVVKNDPAQIAGSSEDNCGAAPIGFRGRTFDPGQVTISQHYIGSKTCDVVPAAPSSPPLPTFSEHRANSVTPTLDRSKIYDSPQLPFIQKSLGSNLRFSADDTKSLSSELSISSGRTPSETSSTPSDMRVKKCHDVGAAITRVATSPPSFSPVLIGNETFRCARCVKRSGLPLATAGKRTGSSLRPTGHKALHLASTEGIKSGLLDDNARPTKRQKLDHAEGYGLLHVPRTLNLLRDCNRPTSAPIQTQAYLKDKPSSSENNVLNHPLNGSVGSADDRACLQAHSHIEHSVIPIEAPAPGPNKEHEHSESVSEAGRTSVTTDRGQCQEPAKQLTVDAHTPSEPDHESDRRPLRARDSSIQPISTAVPVETSGFVDIDSFDLGVRPYESNVTLLDSDPSAERAPGTQARKQSSIHGSDDDALSDKSMSIESDQPEPTDTNNSVRRSSSPALIADKFDSLERQDHAKSIIDLPSSERFGSISPLSKRPPSTVNASSANLSATSITTPRSNDVTNTYASATADHNHRHSSAAKIYSEAANPSLKKYPLTPCSMCGKPVFTSFSKNSTKTLCTGCAKVNESNLPTPCTTTQLNDRLLSPESSNMASLNQAPLSPPSKKAVSLDKSKQSLQSKAKAQQSRPLKVFPEQSSPFRTAPLRTQRQFLASKVNGAPALSSRPVANPQQPELAINGHIGVETRVDLPKFPALTKQHEKTIPLAIPSPPEKVSQVGKAPGHPETNDRQKQLTPHVGFSHEKGKGSSIVHTEAALATNEAVVEQRQYAGESDQRIKDLGRALAAKELEFERAKIEIAALKEQSSRNNKLEHDHTIKANDRTITGLGEELQKLQQQPGIKDTPPSIYTEKDLLMAWPQYHPKNVWFNRSAKIAEIKSRPSRKATFGKRLANIRKDRSNVHHEVDRSPPTSHSIPKPPRYDRDVEETRPPGGLESYGAGSPEPTVISDAESDKELSFEELIGVPPNAIPTIYDKALAYRDGTRDKKGKLPRAKVVYKVGRNVAGQLK